MPNSLKSKTFQNFEFWPKKMLKTDFANVAKGKSNQIANNFNAFKMRSR